MKISLRTAAAAAMAAILLQTIHPLTAQAAPAYESKWTQPITIETLMGEGLEKDTDANGVYEELKQGFRFKTITQGSVYYMFLNGGKIPTESLRMLYEDGYISGFLYKFMAGLPFSPQDLQDVFSPAAYYGANPDVAANLPYDANVLLLDFLQNGMPQGKIGSAEFNPAVYRYNYPEISAVLGDSWMNYYLHYILIGKEQGLTGSRIVR